MYWRIFKHQWQDKNFWMYVGSWLPAVVILAKANTEFWVVAIMMSELPFLWPLIVMWYNRQKPQPPEDEDEKSSPSLVPVQVRERS